MQQRRQQPIAKTVAPVEQHIIAQLPSRVIDVDEDARGRRQVGGGKQDVAAGIGRHHQKVMVHLRPKPRKTFPAGRQVKQHPRKLFLQRRQHIAPEVISASLAVLRLIGGAQALHAKRQQP